MDNAEEGRLAHANYADCRSQYIYRATCKPEPELIDLMLSDSEDETAILPPPPPVYEILDTSRSIRVRSHEEIPVEVLVSFVQGYHRYSTSALVPDTVTATGVTSNSRRSKTG